MNAFDAFLILMVGVPLAILYVVLLLHWLNQFLDWLGG